MTVTLTPYCEAMKCFTELETIYRIGPFAWSLFFLSAVCTYVVISMLLKQIENGGAAWLSGGRVMEK
jgi:hypothetical protein